jgi:DNA polymerase-3 subunit delta'
MTPWPPGLAGTPASAVIDRAIADRRLGHSLLLHGDDVDLLSAGAEAIAAALLGAPPSGHPDFFALRPAGKSRQITAESTRSLIDQVQMSPSVAAHKVAILYEVDRMNPTSANIFLKTLEEPPARTMLLLLTTHPYALLPTIRSRCFHFRFAPARGAGPAAPSAAAGWGAWLDDYRAWLGRLGATSPDKSVAADHVLSLYGLVARFSSILHAAVAQAWDRQKASLPEDLDEDAQIAIEAGLSHGLRARLLADVAEATRRHVRGLKAADAAVLRSFPAAIGQLERDGRLLRLNLNEAAALEDFLLASLRIWTRR